MLRTKKRALFAGLTLSVACLALLPTALTGSPANSTPADIGATAKPTRLYFPGRLYMITLSKKGATGYNFPTTPPSNVTCTFQPGNQSWPLAYYGPESTNVATLGFTATSSAIGTITITIDDPVGGAAEVTLDPIPVQPMSLDPCPTVVNYTLYLDKALRELDE